MILAGDIGGTKVNLAFFTVGAQGVLPGVMATYPSREHASLEEIVRQFLATHQLAAERACFGVAGPVRQGRAQLTNLPWTVDTQAITSAFGFKQVSLLNDLEANAYGVVGSGLPPQDFVVLNAGAPEAAGNAAIIAAGTGLGEAGIYWNGKAHCPFACEGGHADFSPRTDLDAELLRYLRAVSGQVSWEHVLSGPGLFNLYKFLRDAGRGKEPEWLAEAIRRDDPPAVITRAALEDKCALCVQTLDLFVTYYGMEAANLALKVMATGGVYVGGGIAPKIIGKLKTDGFMKAFCGEGRMKQLLAAMPVRVILNDKTALIGAARFAAMESGLKG